MAESKQSMEGFIQFDSFFVAGYKYYDGELVERKLRQGDTLVLKWDQHNPFDQRAVEIFSEHDFKLGYIPADQNNMTAFFLDQDIALKATVRELRTELDSWNKLRVDIFVTDRIRDTKTSTP